MSFNGSFMQYVWTYNEDDFRTLLGAGPYPSFIVWKDASIIMPKTAFQLLRDWNTPVQHCKDLFSLRVLEAYGGMVHRLGRTVAWPAACGSRLGVTRYIADLGLQTCEQCISGRERRLVPSAGRDEQESSESSSSKFIVFVFSSFLFLSFFSAGLTFSAMLSASFFLTGASFFAFGLS